MSLTIPDPDDPLTWNKPGWNAMSCYANSTLWAILYNDNYLSIINKINTIGAGQDVKKIIHGLSSFHDLIINGGKPIDRMNFYINSTLLIREQLAESTKDKPEDENGDNWLTESMSPYHFLEEIQNILKPLLVNDDLFHIQPWGVGDTFENTSKNIIQYTDTNNKNVDINVRENFIIQYTIIPNYPTDKYFRIGQYELYAFLYYPGQGHYSCFFSLLDSSNQRIWYKFDDISRVIELIGDISNINPLEFFSETTLFFYKKNDTPNFLNEMCSDKFTGYDIKTIQQQPQSQSALKAAQNAPTPESNPKSIKNTSSSGPISSSGPRFSQRLSSVQSLSNGTVQLVDDCEKYDEEWSNLLVDENDIQVDPFNFSTNNGAPPQGSVSQGSASQGPVSQGSVSGVTPGLAPASGTLLQITPDELFIFLSDQDNNVQKTFNSVIGYLTNISKKNEVDKNKKNITYTINTAIPDYINNYQASIEDSKIRLNDQATTEKNKIDYNITLQSRIIGMKLLQDLLSLLNKLNDNNINDILRSAVEVQKYFNKSDQAKILISDAAQHHPTEFRVSQSVVAAAPLTSAVPSLYIADTDLLNLRNNLATITSSTSNIDVYIAKDNVAELKGEINASGELCETIFSTKNCYTTIPNEIIGVFVSTTDETSQAYFTYYTEIIAKINEINTFIGYLKDNNIQNIQAELNNIKKSDKNQKSKQYEEDGLELETNSNNLTSIEFHKINIATYQMLINIDAYITQILEDQKQSNDKKIELISQIVNNVSKDLKDIILLNNPDIFKVAEKAVPVASSGLTLVPSGSQPGVQPPPTKALTKKAAEEQARNDAAEAKLLELKNPDNLKNIISPNGLPQTNIVKQAISDATTDTIWAQKVFEPDTYDDNDAIFYKGVIYVKLKSDLYYNTFNNTTEKPDVISQKQGGGTRKRNRNINGGKKTRKGKIKGKRHLRKTRKGKRSKKHIRDKNKLKVNKLRRTKKLNLKRRTRKA